VKQDAAADFDPIEAEFFAREAQLSLEPEWVPDALPRQTRLAIGATLGMLAAGMLGFAAFVIHATWVVPAPEPLGASVRLPDPPPIAASNAGLPMAVPAEEQAAPPAPGGELARPAEAPETAEGSQPAAAEPKRPTS
jgi:hypothetical protein